MVVGPSRVSSATVDGGTAPGARRRTGLAPPAAAAAPSASGHAAPVASHATRALGNVAAETAAAVAYRSIPATLAMEADGIVACTDVSTAVGMALVPPTAMTDCGFS